jgi:hypothetical protein
MAPTAGTPGTTFQARDVNTGPLPAVTDAGPVTPLPPGNHRGLGPIIRVVWSHQLPPGSVMPQGGAVLGTANGIPVLVVDSALSPQQRRTAIRVARRSRY